MQKYKIEFTKSEYYIIDILANSEDEAKTLAEDKYIELDEQGILHYHEHNNPTVEISNTFDVTNTEDPFDALNA